MENNDLAKRISEADRAYYNSGHPIMSDKEYDGLRTLLKHREPDHPLFSKVGDIPSSLWNKATHQIPMGSLEKVNTLEEFEAWYTKHLQIYILEPKLDGLSLSILYEDGDFVQAITRGDGHVGEDISANVQKMKGFIRVFPLKYKFTGAVRCEILLLTADFDRINSVLPEEEKYENCRNAASGISRRLDGKFCPYLNLIYYDIQMDLDEDAKINFLRDHLFNTPMYAIGGFDKMHSSFKQLTDTREKLPYKIDGAVIKLNSFKAQQDLGSLNGRPKGQIAWKFDPPGSATTLNDVVWETGRTGVVTPIGLVEPVFIDGSTIQRVTLHNVAEIARLGVGLGDLVLVIKANDIIPKITEVIESKGRPIPIPTQCPSCGGPLNNDGIRLSCPSDLCPAKGHRRILNWIKTVGIDNLGESTLEALEIKGRVKMIRDIYTLTKEDISTMAGYGDKSADKIIESINKTRTLTLDQFLAGIGIPSISTKTAADLMNNLKYIKAIQEVKVEELKKIKGYSDISAAKIVDGLRKFEPEIIFLLEIITIGEKQDGKFSGLSFCFTGELSQSRSYYQGLVMKNGGTNDSSVTKTTAYLVCGQNVGATKTEKAQKYGTKVINEKDFMSMLGISVNLPEEPAPSPKVTNKAMEIKTESLFGD